MKQKTYNLNLDQLKKISSIIESEKFGYTLYSEDKTFSIYSNKLNKKKIVYTTNKSTMSFAQYIHSIAKESAELIQNYNYSDMVDVFCSNFIDHQLNEQLRKEVLDNTGIQICIFDLNAIKTSQIDNVNQFLSVIWDLENNTNAKLDGFKKALFDILVSGKETTDIKNNLLHSVIVLSIFNGGNHVLITDLKASVVTQLGKDVGNFDIVLQQMGGLKIIEYDKTTRKHVMLSTETYEKVDKIVAEAKRIENDFANRFREILDSHNISNDVEILEKLISLYQYHFAAEDTEEFDKRADSAYKALFNLVRENTSECIASDVIREIRTLCENSTYLDSISASSSFIGMYQNNQLDEYINTKQKCIFLDTPLLVYLLCYHSLELPSHYDWQQSQYKSTIELYKLQNKNSSNILLFTMQDYIQETVGEYKKALQMGWLESVTDINFLKSVNNTFYNYYRYLMENPELYDDSDKVKCFDDFATEILSFNNTCIDSPDIDSDTIKDLKNLIENNYGIKIESFRQTYESEKDDITKRYQSTLEHSKSSFASSADAKTLVYLSRIGKMESTDYSKDVELYLSTWDRTFDKFRAQLFKDDCPNRFFITTPAKLVNKIVLANFDINNNCITNDVFLFADQNFGLREKVVKFVNRVAPIFGRKSNTNRFYKSILDWYKEEVESDSNYEASEGESYSIQEHFILTLFDQLNKILKPEQIIQLTNDSSIDRGVQKLFLKYKKNYTSDNDAERNVDLLTKEIVNYFNNKVVNFSEPTLK